MNKKYRSQKANDKINSELTQTESLIRDKLVIEYHFGLSESPFAKQKRLASTLNSSTKGSSQDAQESPKMSKKPSNAFPLPSEPEKDLKGGFADYDILMDDCDDESSGVVEFFVKKIKSEETSPKVLADRARISRAAGKRVSLKNSRF